MVDKARLTSYLEALDRVLQDWDKLLKESSEERLKTDRFHCHLVCHVLLLSVQTALDIAGHVVASRGWPRPSRAYRDIFETLGSHSFVSTGTAAELAHLADFRNTLTHEYVHLDTAQVWRELQTGNDPLRELHKKATGLLG
jgi:uncharacterized protein YutE (UPF0331/DUF86 family)